MNKLTLACLVLTASTLMAYDADIHKEFQMLPGKRLEMNLNTGGDIKITGQESNMVSIDVYFKGRDDKECKVDVDQTAAGPVISSRYQGRHRNHSTSLLFDVKVPKKFDLDLDSKGGAFTIDGVEGSLDGKTMGGQLHLTKLRGTVNFHTMGGNITLTQSNVDGEVKTNGGKVLLEDVVGNVNGHSMGGAVVYRNVTDRTGTGTGKMVKITTMGGEISVSDAPHGADVSTMGGDVQVHSAAKFVKAKTMGGDITIDEIDGWVEAQTMGGDVNVTMVGNAAEGRRHVDISSNGGDITLTVPGGLSMDVDIALAYTDDGWFGLQNFRIESDFEIQEDRSKEWDRPYGTPRRYIYGKGSINGGKNRIHIETINGNVYLKKGK